MKSKKMTSGMKKTKESFSQKLFMAFKGRKLNDEFYEELEQAMLSADMGVTATMNVLDQLRDEIFERRLTEPQQAREVLKELLAQSIDFEIEPLSYPCVILLSGVNGVGKTTAIGKLAHLFKENGKSVTVAAADTFRAAASEQLEVWADRADVRIVHHEEGSDPAAVVFDAVASVKAKNTDVLLIDTAGRLHNKKNLMEELKKISRIVDRDFSSADFRKYIVLDATTGQNAVQQASTFTEAIDLDGIILTKLDGTAKGGVVLAIAEELGLPVMYVGVGEGIDDLIEFSPSQFVDELFE